MSIHKKVKQRALRRTFRNRRKMTSRGIKPRVSVFRSLNHISAQIIDDAKHCTVVSFSSQNLTAAVGDKKAIAKQVGLELGKRAAEKAIKDVFFDRGGYKYHGRVQALADGLRESGLNF